VNKWDILLIIFYFSCDINFRVHAPTHPKEKYRNVTNLTLEG